MTRASEGSVAAVAVEGITKAFAGRVVLDGVSFAVGEGELTAILGASGSGKTTLLRLLAGFDRGDAGEIWLGGTCVDAGRTHVPPERRNVGYVPQEGSLFPHLDVGGNVGFGLARGRFGRTSASRQRRVDELLELVGLAGLARRMPQQLSGGERQRVALARALASRPTLVLLDEPFSSLDVELRTAMRRDVVEVLDKAGATAVLVTHDQDEALSIADRVAVLQHGRIVQYDEPAELYIRPMNGEVARFVGHGNLLLGRLERGVVRSVLGLITVELRTPGADGVAVGVLVRPEQIVLTPLEQAPADDRLPCGVVVNREFHGHDVLLGVRLDEPAWGQVGSGGGGFEFLARLPGADAAPTGRPAGRDSRARHVGRLADGWLGLRRALSERTGGTTAARADRSQRRERARHRWRPSQGRDAPRRRSGRGRGSRRRCAGP